MSELFEANIHLDLSYADVGEVQINSVVHQTRVIRLRRYVPVNSRGSQDIEILIPKGATFVWPDDLFEAEMERRAISMAELARRAADKLNSTGCKNCNGSGWVTKTANTTLNGRIICPVCYNRRAAQTPGQVP